MFAAEPISYQQTGAFSKLVVDYVAGSQQLRPFYSLPPTMDGIISSIEIKKKADIDRKLLVEVLTEQYKPLPLSEAVSKNIQSLLSPDTFTVCTAHQPNLLTGPLYFIYKIVHAIKLAMQLNATRPPYHFVPVYYMGSEDADLQELNHFTVRGKKYVWNTGQKGAVGRMKVDEDLINLLDELEGQIGVEKHGKKLSQLFKAAYTKGTSVQHATFQLVHSLFQQYGLVIINPDDKRLKAKATPVFEKDIFAQTSAAIVTKTSESLNKHYKVQAYPREINLFYLKDDIRQRIIKKGNEYVIHETNINFTEQGLKEELRLYPERFSPNVILRGVFQEMILPNIAFIGGGGELAYWLQLKDLFTHSGVPFPVQVLRNSFLVVEGAEENLLKNLNISTHQIFQSEIDVLNTFIQRAGKMPQINGLAGQIKKMYDEIGCAAGSVDKTLLLHVAALQAKALKQLTTLEKKMGKAERKKYADVQQQIHKLKHLLLPNGGLQERVENFSWYYAKWGPAFIDALVHHSTAVDQKFTVLHQRMA